MKTTSHISIPKPCTENWDQMSPAKQGRFCKVCTKNVVDVSGWNQHQIHEAYVKEGNNLCIRIPEDQLNLQQPFSTKAGYAPIRWILVLLAIWGARFQQIFAQTPPPPAEKNDSITCEKTLRIYGEVKQNEGFIDIPLSFVSIRIMNGDVLLAGSYTMADGTFSVEIPRSKIEGLNSATLVIMAPGYGTKRIILNLNDTVQDPKLREGDATLKEQIIILSELVKLYPRSMIMGDMVYYREIPARVELSRTAAMKHTDNNPTFSQEDLQRYNFNR